MAHELNFRNGVADMFSVRETPWHKEGHLLTEAPTLEEAIRLAGHDFEVETVPLYVRRTTQDGDEYFVEVNTTHRATMRQDNNEVLGVVGGRYHVLQNIEAFSILEPLLDAGLAELETGGTLRGGRDVWMQVRWNFSDPVIQEVFSKSGVEPYCLLANNHAGWRQVTLQNSDIRVVCANTLGWALGKQGQVKIRHTATVKSKLVAEAQTFWKALLERYTKVAGQMEALQNRFLTEEEFSRAVLDVLAPFPEKKGDKAPAPAIVERQMDKRRRLDHMWVNGAGHTGDYSAWEAVNGAIESLDHDSEMWKVRGSRTEAMMFEGTLSLLKQKVVASVHSLL